MTKMYDAPRPGLMAALILAASVLAGSSVALAKREYKEAELLAAFSEVEVQGAFREALAGGADRVALEQLFPRVFQQVFAQHAYPKVIEEVRRSAATTGVDLAEMVEQATKRVAFGAAFIEVLARKVAETVLPNAQAEARTLAEHLNDGFVKQALRRTEAPFASRAFAAEVASNRDIQKTHEVWIDEAARQITGFDRHGTESKTLIVVQATAREGEVSVVQVRKSGVDGVDRARQGRSTCAAAFNELKGASGTDSQLHRLNSVDTTKAFCVPREHERVSPRGRRRGIPRDGLHRLTR